MATYKETVRQGVDTTTTWKYTDAAGRLDFTIKNSDYATDGVVDQSETTDFVYDAGGRLTAETYSMDLYADSTVEWQNFRTLAYDAAGRLVTDTNSSPDLDGDLQPNYSDTTTYVYDAAGRVTAKDQYFYFNGVFNGIDERHEVLTYNAQGRLYEHYTDDSSLYDFTVGKQYTYDSSGRVTKVKTMDPFVFGDEAWHNAETYKYSGTKLIEVNKYDEFMNGVHVLEDKAKFTFNSKNLITKEAHTGQDANWHTITGYQNEFWYDAQNRLTTELTSFDVDGNGVMEVGTRTLQGWTYNTDNTVASYSVDNNAGDGVVEYLMTNELLVA